jgi:hypothetical protein
VRGVVEAVERRLYSFEEVCGRFCNRSAREILEDGHIHFATPCHDLCTLAMERLSAHGFEPVPVLSRIHRWFQPVKFQCGIEMRLDRVAVYVGFSVSTNRLAPGRFVPIGGRTHVVRARHDSAPRGAPFLAFFDVRHPAELDVLFHGHALPRHLRTYRGSTRRRAFDRACQRAWQKLQEDGSGELLSEGRWRAVRADGTGDRVASRAWTPGEI